MSRGEGAVASLMNPVSRAGSLEGVTRWPLQRSAMGVLVPQFSGADSADQLGSKLAAVARTADEAGFDSIAVMDHFFQISMVGPPENYMLEAYTTLGSLAACTSRARLLTLVTGVVYRHP